jgi:hypothetical protein
LPPLPSSSLYRDDGDGNDDDYDGDVDYDGDGNDDDYDGDVDYDGADYGDDDAEDHRRDSDDHCVVTSARSLRSELLEP